AEFMQSDRQVGSITLLPADGHALFEAGHGALEVSLPSCRLPQVPKCLRGMGLMPQLTPDSQASFQQWDGAGVIAGHQRQIAPVIQREGESRRMTDRLRLR